MKILYSFAFSICVLLANFANAQEKIQFKPTQGYSFEGVLNMKTDIKTMGEQKGTTTMQYFIKANVIEVESNGNVKVNVVTTRATVKIVALDKDGKEVTKEHDTNNPNKATDEKMEDLANGLNQIIGKQATLTVQPDGKVIKNEGLPEEAAQLGKYFEGLFASLPPKTVQVGDTWEQEIEDSSSGIPSTTRLRHTTTELTAKEFKYTSKGDMEMMGMKNSDALNGKVTIDKTTGVLLFSNTIMKYTMDLGESMKMEFLMDVTFEKTK